MYKPIGLLLSYQNMDFGMYVRGYRIFWTSRCQGIVKSTVSWVFEDLKFKISEGYDQNWSFPDSAQLAVSVS